MTRTAGIILAGGLARRMGGGDKSLQPVGGQTILARTIATVGPQVAALAINANGDPGRFLAYGLPVLHDPLPGYPGPLAGILAGLDWAATIGADHVLSVPGDCPFLPENLVARLHAVRAEGSCARAASGGWTHPVVALWPVDERERLRAALLAGERKIDAYTGEIATAVWATEPFDPFFNINTPEDLARGNALSQRLRDGSAGGGKQLAAATPIRPSSPDGGTVATECRTPTARPAAERRTPPLNSPPPQTTAKAPAKRDPPCA